MSCADCPNLIVTGEYSTKKFERSYFKPHGVPLKSAALEAIRVCGAPTKYIAYSKSKQITSIEEILEIAKQKEEKPINEKI